MPYIDEMDREALDRQVSGGLAGRSPNTAGELNYVITTLVDRWISDRGLTYENINAAVGVLECAKLELYRRVAAPYEHEKMRQNGDVYKNAPRNFHRPVWSQRDGGM